MARRRADQFGPQARACMRSRCVACLHARRPDRGMVVAHHLRTRGAGGLDDVTIPLCWRCHDELHNEGRWSFWIRRRIPLTVVQAALDSVRRGVPWSEWDALPY